MSVTLTVPFEARGVGLHGGQPVRMIVAPASAGSGIVFRRSDLPGSPTVPARHDLVGDTTLCTRLIGPSGASVGTVEHLMAALAGLGVTDTLVTLDGPEVPIMDGSAARFVEAILEAGLTRLPGRARAIRIRRTITVSDGDKSATLHPAPRFGMSFRIRFDDAAIGDQALSLCLAGPAFAEELAECRTFGRLSDVERLRAAGLGLGGSLDNAIVVDGGRVLNRDGLRRPDEFVRHKMLDAVGDLALAGAPIIGHYEGVKAGHGLTNVLLGALFADPQAWDWVEPGPGQLPAAGRFARTAAARRIAV